MVVAPVCLSCTEHGAEHAPVQLRVVGGALGILPHAHVHLLQGRTHRTPEVDGAPAWGRLHFERTVGKSCSKKGYDIGGQTDL